MYPLAQPIQAIVLAADIEDCTGQRLGKQRKKGGLTISAKNYYNNICDICKELIHSLSTITNLGNLDGTLFLLFNVYYTYYTCQMFY